MRKRVACVALIVSLTFAGWNTANAEVITFRSVVDIPIKFSIRNSKEAEPIIRELEARGAVDFDLPADGRFDIW